MPSPTVLPFRTARLLVRPVEATDAAAFLSWRSIPEVMEFMYQSPWTAETAEAKLADWAATRELEKTGDAIQFAVAPADAPAAVFGELMLKRAEGHGQAEIGWTLHPRSHGNGYATEAARGLLGLAFDALGFHRVYARLDEDNTASAHVAERLGMRLEARLVENDRRPPSGVWATELDYAILAAEFVAGRVTPAT